MTGPGPTERPVPADSAPEQAAAAVQRVTESAGSPPEAPFGVEQKGMFGVTQGSDTSGFGGLLREPWSPPPAERPYGSYFDELVDSLRAAYPAFDQGVTMIVVDRGEL